MSVRGLRVTLAPFAACALGLVVGGCSSDDSAAAPLAGADASIIAPVGDAAAADVAVGAEAGTLTLKWVVQEAPNMSPGASDAGLPDGGLLDAAAGDSDGSPSADGGGLQSTAPIPGVEVCVDGYPTIACATTDANGAFTLHGFAALTDYSLLLKKDGYLPVLKPIETASIDMDGNSNPLYLGKPMGADGGADSGIPGLTIDWQNLGQVDFFVIGPSAGNASVYAGDPGAKVSLAPTASGPYYLRTDGTFDLAATSLVDALGWYYNLTPGTYTLTVDDAAHDCAPISFPFGSSGFPVPPHGVRFPVKAGYLTELIGFFCTPNSTVVDAGGR